MAGHGEQGEIGVCSQEVGDGALVLLRPDRPLAGALREDGWRVLGTSDTWVLLSRP